MSETPSAPPEAISGNQYNSAVQSSEQLYIDTHIGRIPKSQVPRVNAISNEISRLIFARNPLVQLTARIHRKLVLQCFRGNMTEEEAVDGYLNNFTRQA